MWIRFFLLGLLLFALASTAGAASVALELNDHSAQAGFRQTLPGQGYGDSLVGARLLYNENRDVVLGGIYGGVTGSPGNVGGLTFGVMLALNLADLPHGNELIAAGVGLEARYLPPQLMGVGLDTHLTYGPDIFTFGDADNYLESGLGLSYQVLPNARLTLGYQHIRASLGKHHSYRLDNTLRLGVVLDF
jgi:opacity protein-like surface antigen